ncbi:hypothetical protein SCA6_018074 [Theobroma cacao]
MEQVMPCAERNAISYTISNGSVQKISRVPTIIFQGGGMDHVLVSVGVVTQTLIKGMQMLIVACRECKVFKQSRANMCHVDVFAQLG